MDLIRDLIESLPEPHLIVTRDGVCIEANSSFAKLINFSQQELRNSDSDHFWPAVIEALDNTGEHAVELIDSSGRSITARVSCVVGEVAVVKVLASAAHGESLQLHHKQRLETLGILAGGVAHDFNNVLTGILGHVAYLKHVLPDPFNKSESLMAIEEGALKASGLTQQILNFSKLDASDELRNVDVDQVLGRIAVLLKSAIPSDIALNTVRSYDGFTVLGSEVHISQILINLIINARDAIQGKGSIEVRLVAPISDDEAREIFGSEPAASSYGAIEVTDSGSGMSDEVKQRLFEPYFTTKNEAGTGLGLSTVNSIVTQLGGAIQVFSEVGQGTLFRIILPLAAGSSSQLGQVGDNLLVARGAGERILVIDDEDAVRNVLGLSLSHLGYQVDTAPSGLEGLERFKEAQGAYGLVILDLLMPGLSGEETFNRLRALDPHLSVLIVSGFSSEHVVTRVLEDGARDFIQKPFSIEVLSEKVRGCLSDQVVRC
jgi:two-component system cell cycle sensor histidine kinase/response regulator CckA